MAPLDASLDVLQDTEDCTWDPQLPLTLHSALIARGVVQVAVQREQLFVVVLLYSSPFPPLTKRQQKVVVLEYVDSNGVPGCMVQIVGASKNLEEGEEIN